MVSVEDVMPLASYAAYRQLARQGGYLEPWAPYIGARYGAEGQPRILYCGAAPYLRDDENPLHEGTDEEAWRLSLEHWSSFAADGAYHSAFWRLARSIVSALIGPGSDSTGFSDIAWTNLSKLNTNLASAPRSSDKALRALDVAQLKREIRLLRPDLVVCVSGRLLVPTGNEAFADMPKCAFEPSTPKTLVKRLEGGGALFWTMHPNRKSQAWMQSVVSDLQRLRSAENPPSASI